MKDNTPPINWFRKRKYVEESESEADISDLHGRDTFDIDDDDSDDRICGAYVNVYDADEDCYDSDGEDNDQAESITICRREHNTHKGTGQLAVKLLRRMWKMANHCVIWDTEGLLSRHPDDNLYMIICEREYK